jgi:hypothetical protein
MQILIILTLIVIFYIIWKYWTLPLGAGYDPTPMDKVDKMLRLAKVDEHDTLYDLGSGDGRIIFTAVRKYGAKAVGIEADPFRFFISWLFVLLSGRSNRIRFKFGNFFRNKIGDATIVTVFLYGPTNNKLKDKFLKELKPGTRVVSYIWQFDGWKPDAYLPDDRIYLYVIRDTN